MITQEDVGIRAYHQQATEPAIPVAGIMLTNLEISKRVESPVETLLKSLVISFMFLNTLICH